jgi:2,3-bisphosphoglycerate-independent phosphoglycerate mutase
MKYAIVIPDGCADEPLEALGGKTPLQAAQTPAMEEIARLGVVGRANNVPAHLPAGSDVANLSLFGYDPNKYFTGRAPLEAAAQGIKLAPEDWAIRCNVVTVENQVMRSFHPWRELSQLAHLSRSKEHRTVHARHAGHATA